MLRRPTRARLLALLLLAGAPLAGCGKSLPSEGRRAGAGITTVASAGALAASGLATKNTTRLGGANPVADAAAVALAVDPGLTPATRPPAVVLVDAREWTAALAASALASAPLGAPLLYAEGDALPAISGEALRALRPLGAAPLGGAQVIAIGTSAAPAGYRTRSLDVASRSSEPAGGAAATDTASAGVRARASEAARTDAEAALAVGIERLVALARGAPPRRVIVVGADGPRALAMPAAGLAAETGAPILAVAATGIPPATRRALKSLHRPAIYAVGPAAAVSEAVLAKLARLGAVHRIDATADAAASSRPGAGGTSGATPEPSVGGAAAGAAVATAIAVARYSDGPFGWGVEEPGHGLVFANASRPLDAPAAAALSASGDYGPLLLLETAGPVPRALVEYLSDIQPSYPEYEPTRGFYNHGWLIGGEAAIAARTQAELDAMLESAPRRSSDSPTTP
jgi:hypothetical protein